MVVVAVTVAVDHAELVLVVVVEEEEVAVGTSRRMVRLAMEALPQMMVIVLSPSTVMLRRHWLEAGKGR